MIGSDRFSTMNQVRVYFVDHYRAVLAGMAGAAVLLLVFAVAGISGVDVWIEANEELASWVQALGSIAAIIGAASIAGDQWRRQQQVREADRVQEQIARREEAAEILSMLVVVTGQVATFAGQIVEGLEKRPESLTVLASHYPPALTDLRTDLDRLLDLHRNGKSARRLIFNVRGTVGVMIIALRSAHTEILSRRPLKGAALDQLTTSMRSAKDGIAWNLKEAQAAYEMLQRERAERERK